MNSNEPITLTRDVEGTIVPVGDIVTLRKGELAHITQSLGNSYTIIVNGNMFRLADKDVDALGIEVAAKQANPSGQRRTLEEVEQEVWNQLKTCYDPEIPVNIVDLGLVYNTELTAIAETSSYRADLKITLTAAGCGMGPALASDVVAKLQALDEITEATCDVVFEPTWNQSMMSEAAKLDLGMF
ncbi:MAG: putative FeS assembly SUF system protein SufT [Paracoccaceae bacterium]|jgi:probable FeS assembly SUF system protein SufT